MKLGVMCSGNGTNFENILRTCNKDEVVLMITNKRNCGAVTRAKKFGIPCAYSKNESWIINEFKWAGVDLIVLAGYMRIISPTFVESFPNRIINIHPSLLPDYPGLNTHKQAIDNGDLMHGISVHYVNNELDGGPIIAQGALKIDPAQSEAKLINRIHKIEHAIFPKVIADITKGYITLQGAEVKFEDESHFGPNHMEFFNV